ncbi:MAG TPA: energy transducer TonB [Acidobacteriaceae bacterium]|jgi:hypothetical protein|nr:energy transducer TonB [Acidobacteriaceae bacterium]
MKSAWLAAFALLVVSSPLSHPQQTSSEPTPANQPTPEAEAAAVPTPQDVLAGPVADENALRQVLVGKQLYLRGLWLDDELHFRMDGSVASPSPKGSFTLCAVEIEHVRVTKKRVELEGVRYGIHFADEGSWAEQATSFDRIRVTPKKKHLEIVIDRQQVLIPKKKKGDSAPAAAGAQAQAAAGGAASTAVATPAASAQEPAASRSGGPTAQPEPSKETAEATTQDPAKAAQELRIAVNRIFAPGLDAAMIAEMPDYWQFFYHAQQEHKSIEPTDPSIVRPGPGVDGPKLLKNLVASSNDYAQKSQVAGVASYKVILGPDGKPIAVAVYRPIGFGLDENAVAAIRKSTFAPAVKGGKAMSSVVDVSINFRIYSKLTSQAPANAQDASDGGANISPVTGKASLPGPFSTQAEVAKQ